MLGQLGKFIQPGAYRIESDYGSPRTVTNAVFLNPDGTIVMVVVNQTRKNQTFKVITEYAQFRATIPDKTVATYKWQIDQ